jgi:hypothetical protein
MRVMKMPVYLLTWQDVEDSTEEVEAEVEAHSLADAADFARDRFPPPYFLVSVQDVDYLSGESGDPSDPAVKGD